MSIAFSVVYSCSETLNGSFPQGSSIAVRLISNSIISHVRHCAVTVLFTAKNKRKETRHACRPQGLISICELIQLHIAQLKLQIMLPALFSIHQEIDRDSHSLSHTQRTIRLPKHKVSPDNQFPHQWRIPLG